MSILVAGAVTALLFMGGVLLHARDVRSERRRLALDAAIARQGRELRHAASLIDELRLERDSGLAMTRVVVAEARRGLDAVNGLAVVMRGHALGVTERLDIADHLQQTATRVDGLVLRLVQDAPDASRRLDARLAALDACAALAGRAEQAGVILERPDRPSRDQAPPSIYADPHRLHDLLVDLLTAAVGQARRGAVVRVAAQTVDTHARLVVTHEGGAIERRGIDVALLRRRAEALGGWLEIEADEARGRAVVVLPLADAAAAPHLPEGCIVLCVEAERAQRVLLRSRLTDLGAGQVYAAVDFEEGERLARELAPDLIVADASQVTAARRFRQALTVDPLTRRIPVVGLGAGLDGGEADAARAAGFEGWVGRPVTVDALADAVNVALAGRFRVEVAA